tara:strand:- start:588 stop:2312 length:1725 start_codon:yes stop_codon:yes gene_type:complete
MANNNRGIAAYLPFPTFGGGQKTGGVTPVQLPASQMRFPTSSYSPVRRAPEPTLKETLAPFLPIALEGIGSLLKKDPETLTDEKYLADLGGLSEEPTLEAMQGNKKKLARLEAYKQFGEPEEKDTFGFDDILSMVIGSQMGRGAKDFAASSRAIDKAKETARLTKQTNRANYLNTALKDVDNLTYAGFENTETAKAGVDTYRGGFVDPSGEVYIFNEDKTGYTNVKALEGNWVKTRYTPTSPLSAQMKDPRLATLQELNKELSTKDQSLVNTVTLTNAVNELFQEGINDPEKNPLTAVTSFGNILNSVKSNANQILSFVGGGNISNAFGISAADGGSNGREGSGQYAKQLHAALQTGDEAQITQAMDAFENSNAAKTEGFSFRNSLGDMAYANIRTRALMLQLAYAAAATAGQTGRTLSDKDLAFFLKMVGYGATQDPEIAQENLLDFIDTTIETTDNVAMSALSLNSIQAGQYPLDQNLFTSILAGYWRPSMKKDEKGKEVPDFFDTGSYKFKDFYTRYGNIPDVKRYRDHWDRKRKEALSEKTSLATDPNARDKQIEEDLKRTDDLYKFLGQ